MERRICLLIVAALLPVARAAAGVVLHETTSADIGNRQTHTEMEVSAEGDGLRADIVSSDLPFTPPGSYMLLPNDEQIYLVNPAKNSYALMDMNDMAGVQQAMQRMQRQMNGGAAAGPQNVVLAKKVDEAGPVMLGLATRHIVYEVNYHQPAPVPNAPVYDVHEKYELWATAAFDARSAAIPALRRAGRLSRISSGGGPEPKEVTDAIASHGFVLKQNYAKESKMTLGSLAMAGPMMLMTRGAGSPHTTSSLTVTEIRDANLQAERFVLPQGYAEVEMMNPNMGAMPDLSKLPGQPGGTAPPGSPGPQMPDLNDIPK